jgi:hypothetical protein
MPVRRAVYLLIPLCFLALALVVTYPTAARLGDFTVFATDSLLEAWTLRWDVHAILGGIGDLLHLWDANIIFPYPDTLAFSEHLLAHALILQPVVLWSTTPMAAANVGVLYTTFLSGLGMYLLVGWLTRNRGAGLIAGVAFAAASFRVGHIIQLHLLSTHWLPFMLLAAAWLVRHRRNSDLLLLILFTNLQFLSSLNYVPIVGLGLCIWLLVWLVACRRQLTVGRPPVGLGLAARLAAFGLVTVAINWPIFQVYQRMSELMGVARTLGDARVYGASLATYLEPIANSLLYARGLGLPGRIDSAFPGLIVLLLALIGLVLLALGRRRDLVWPAVSLLLMAAAGLLLSFGANELALGEAAAPWLGRLLPYPYLFDLVPLLQGFRVPARFALLPAFGLAALAGIGWALIFQRLREGSTGHTQGGRSRLRVSVTALLALLLLSEHLAAPLPGVSVPYGGATYDWLAARARHGAVIELPYYLHTGRSYIELDRVYQSARHWRPIVNGTSGFKPAWMVQLGRVLDAFPDWRSFDLLRRLGVRYVVLHRDEYDAAGWENVTALLPGYLTSVEGVHSAGDDLVLELREPALPLDTDLVAVDAEEFPTLSFINQGAATFVGDPRIQSRTTLGTRSYRFAEPLFVLPGASAMVTLPLDVGPHAGDWEVNLGNLERTLRAGEAAAGYTAPMPPNDRWQSVGLRFSDDSLLQAVAVGPAAVGEALTVHWQWQRSRTAEAAVVRADLSDRFDRPVMSLTSEPLAGGTTTVWHSFPLAETAPPGRYALRVRLLGIDGAEIAPVGAVLSDLPALPVVVRPGAATSPLPADEEMAVFANGVALLGAAVASSDPDPGDWVRFTLYWRAVRAVPADYTVFTQLLGPDGRVWGQHDNPPVGGWYPTSLWLPEEVVTDDYAVRIDPAAAPGDFRLIVGMYDPTTSERAGIIAGAGNDFAMVATITVTVAAE